MKHVLIFVLALVTVASLAQFVRLARWPFRLAFWLTLLFACFLLPGCAMLPMPFQPANQQYNSNMAEGSWLVLDAVDTAQTMHIRASNPTCSYEADPFARFVYGSRNPTPSRVLLTNIALATAHTMVTSWLDDEVAKHDLANDGSVGPWYVGRVLWHGVSLLGTASSVITNRQHGCAL